MAAGIASSNELATQVNKKCVTASQSVGMSFIGVHVLLAIVVRNAFPCFHGLAHVRWRPHIASLMRSNQIAVLEGDRGMCQRTEDLQNSRRSIPDLLSLWDSWGGE
jgi:hypothetical protein